jgi:hypothetical protein
MNIDDLILELEKTKEQYGNIEVTCTATLLPDCPLDKPLPDVFESTVENLRVKNTRNLGLRVRLYM